LVKLYNQFSSSLALHRKKTARDLAFMQELMLKFTHEFFMHHPSIPEDDKKSKDVEANARIDDFMEKIVRGMSELKPLSDREEV